MMNTKVKLIHIGLKLNKKTDADILSYIGGLDTRQYRLKQLIRLGLERDKRRSENFEQENMDALSDVF